MTINNIFLLVSWFLINKKMGGLKREIAINEHIAPLLTKNNDK